MLSKIYTAAIMGVEGKVVAVETDVAAVQTSFFMVGLADTAVREAKKRVVSALLNNGFYFPATKITVNLSPADIKKEGTAYDLPLALGVLISSGQIMAVEDMKRYIVIGELSLNGEIKAVGGVLPMVLGALECGYDNFIVPCENAQEACLAGRGKVYAAKTLTEAVEHISAGKPIAPSRYDISDIAEKKGRSEMDMSDVHGQQFVKRAMEIAAAGGHNMLMIGPPGSGKTMLAKRFTTILPKMTMEESLAATKIYSVAGMLKSDTPLITRRPFRAPHHTLSPIALIGGGRIPKPGRFHLRITEYCFWMNLPNFRNARWKCCANR